MGLRDFFNGIFNSDPTREWPPHLRNVEFDFNQADTATGCGVWLA